jgi:signal transduction histidine kinase
VQINRVDGELVWVALSGRYYKEENIIESVIRDVTDFKENVTELQRLNFELDNFVYHASHDIRSPLRSILGLINILEKEKSAAERTKVTEMIKGSINRLDKLVVDLLSMSRENRLTEPAVNIHFMMEVNNSITNFYHVNTCKNLDIRIQISQKVPFFSDITKIRIILNNLISNAIKYRSYHDESYVHILVYVTKEEAKIEIKDNGEGISAEKLDKIYDMFYRASESSEGSGLGMYIVKNVIKKLNASIEVQSKEGEGSKFTVKIPNLYKK